LLSLRWELSCGANALALLGVRTGLLLRSMLQDLVTVPVALKWPNDVVVLQHQGVAKLAGILIEMQGSMDGPCTVIIGIGINVGWPPDYLQQLRQQLLHDELCAERQALPPVDLRSLDCEPARSRIAALLINRLAAMCIQYEQGVIAPAEELVASWRQHDLLYGKRIQVSTDSAGDVIVADGVADGIDASGAYLVKSGDHTHTFNASSISLRPRQQASA
jgi:BirA family biotin operon repressor/biotin-[acetyl-CoA-carboxylase] ligase